MCNIITADTKIDIGQNFKIEAGPGAGKTKFLVNHINHILRKANNLSLTRKIACITYTNTGVETIYNRLGDSAKNRVEILTIHSFLYKNIVKPYCSFIPIEYELDCAKIEGHDDPYINHTLLYQWLDNEYFNSLSHPNTRNQIKRMPDLRRVLDKCILSMICSIVNNDLIFKFNKKNVPGFAKQNFELLNNHLLDYKKLYWKNGIIDHDDVLYFSYFLIKKYPFILKILCAKYPYVVVDEYQDTNPVQAEIISSLRQAGCIVGVVGDKAQAIYRFQGADVKLFNSFEVNENSRYVIKENHRSSNQIVDFLNKIRTDICQKHSREYDGDKVTLVVGDRIRAYNEAKSMCMGEEIVSLARDNITSNSMKEIIEQSKINKNIIEELKEVDSNPRRNIMLNIIQAIELAHNTKFKEALKKLRFVFGYTEKGKKDAIAFLLKMMSKYAEYENEMLIKLHLLIIESGEISITKVSRGKVKSFYENTLYRTIALTTNIIDDKSNSITIHKAKGAEYDNVFIIGTDTLIKTLVKPDLDNDEEQRINYVAMSRARNRLFLQVNGLNELELENIKNNYDFEIINVK